MRDTCLGREGDTRSSCRGGALPEWQPSGCPVALRGGKDPVDDVLGAVTASVEMAFMGIEDSRGLLCRGSHVSQYS